MTEGKGESEGSIEFLTFMGPMEKILATHGIYPVKDWSTLGSASDGRGLEGSFDPKDKEATLKHFWPRFSGGTEPSLALASGIFGAFIFRKALDAPPAAKVNLPDPEESNAKRQRVEARPEQET